MSNFDNLNEVIKLTYKADFIRAINDDPSAIKQCLITLREVSSIDFKEAFDMIIRYIETRKLSITDQVVEDLFNGYYEVFEQSSLHASSYIALSKCYIHDNGDINKLKSLFTEDFIKDTDYYFNMMIASYYLNLLVERTDDLDELCRVNDILKKQVAIFKAKTGRE